jgi:hypothetical protein
MAQISVRLMTPEGDTLILGTVDALKDQLKLRVGDRVAYFHRIYGLRDDDGRHVYEALHPMMPSEPEGSRCAKRH